MQIIANNENLALCFQKKMHLRRPLLSIVLKILEEKQ